MNDEEALDIIALNIASQALAEAGAWEDYPEIGQFDWDKICDRVSALAYPPSHSDFQMAYNLTASRASDDVAPGGAS